jgi:peptide/nickel transport system ATP-binding protein
VAEPLLDVRDLSVDYVTPDGPVRAVDGLSLGVEVGEVVGIAGESACGKSTFVQALLRILPPPAVISRGEVRFEGRDLLALGEAELRRVRWARISMVFQGSLDALNPVLTVGEQICDAIRAHEQVSPARARERAAALLERVSMGADRLAAFPHQLSGGMRQRVAIAMALALDPALVVLDEPTTALDVIVEREILHGLLDLRRARGFSVLLVTHDLSRMLELSDRVAVMYAARLVEVAPAAALRASPRHPYTEGLLRAFPSVRGEDAPASIPGNPPGLRRPPSGCRFHPRCARADALCRERSPALVPLGGGRAVACHHPV